MSLRCPNILREALARFREDERGAALTEFIIILPVFLIIFSGILKLSKLQSATVQAKIATTGQLWAQANAVQRDQGIPGLSTVAHMTPGAAASKANGILGSRQRGYLNYSDQLDDTKFAGLNINGTAGESGRALSRSIGPGQSIESQTNLQGRIEEDMNNVVDGPTGFTGDLVNDGQSPSGMTSGPSLLSKLSSVASASGARPAIGAGIRYGLVSASFGPQAIPLKVTTVTISTGYDTLVAPVPMSTDSASFNTVGTVRLSLRNYQDYKGLLGIEYTNRL